jgi:hypothetical protein
MNDEEEAGADKVTAYTRAFEEIDAQVFPGPGRGATPSEATASDRWGGPSAATVEAYRRMSHLVVKHQQAHSERQTSMTAGRRPRRTPGSVGREYSGQTVEEAELLDWGAVPNGATTDLVRQLSRMTTPEQSSHGVRSATSCATSYQMNTSEH